ncbi:MAG: phosphate uptake regulator PhoU [Halobacteriales archaeon]|nr:phosphate uptake regulator PhoU [Halobacteriales archaeon]
MEVRKLQLTGGSSIAITLPKRWVEGSGLKAGDAVGCVVRQDGSLLVTPRPNRKRSPQSLDLELGKESSEHLFRRLVGAYLNGYDIIQVRAKASLTPEQRSTARKAVKRAIGLEVVDEGPHSVTIQDFLDPTEFPLEKGLRRMAALAQAMHTDALVMLQEPARADPAGLEERDSEVDRLHWLINKQYHSLLRDARLAERLGMTPSQALNFLLAARQVERVADHAKRIGDNAAELKGVRLDRPSRGRSTPWASRAWPCSATPWPRSSRRTRRRRTTPSTGPMPCTRRSAPSCTRSWT